MDLETIAGGVLKAGSLSGLAALFWQLWNAYDQRRHRLTVMTLRYGNLSAKVFVSYRPKSSHVGLQAEAEVLEPADGVIAGVPRAVGQESTRQSIERAMKQLSAEKKSTVKLLHQPGDPDGVFTGEFFVGGLVEGDLSAMLQVEIWTIGYRRRLASRTFDVSPVD